jgi:hypothetical protein
MSEVTMALSDIISSVASVWCREWRRYDAVSSRGQGRVYVVLVECLDHRYQTGNEALGSLQNRDVYKRHAAAVARFVRSSHRTRLSRILVASGSWRSISVVHQDGNLFVRHPAQASSRSVFLATYILSYSCQPALFLAPVCELIRLALPLPTSLVSG